MFHNSDLPVTGFRRLLFVSLGLFFVGLGAIGAVFPVLPTTPFLLLASYFFARSSPAWRTWLHQLPLWGPILRDWERQRAIRPQAKLAALVCVPTVVATTLLTTQPGWPLTIVVLLVGGCGWSIVWRLPTLAKSCSSATQIVSAN